MTQRYAPPWHSLLQDNGKGLQINRKDRHESLSCVHFQVPSLYTVNNTHRYANIEFFRGLAILIVVLYHFNDLLPFGYIGVDLFFVISGFLVSKPLIVEFCERDTINVKNFWLRRAFKILPSYYFYLFACLSTIWLLDLQVDEQLFSWSYIRRFVFFYRNYTNGPFYLALDHIWSLCVEEHFYLLLPLGFWIMRYSRKRSVVLLILLVLSSLAGVYLLKMVSIQLGIAEGQATTHQRIDGLLLGALMSLLEYQKGWAYARFYQKPWIAWLGLSIVVCVLIARSYLALPLVWEHGLCPIGFAMLIAGSLHAQFEHMAWIKQMAKYSYNWYLWHVLLFVALGKHIHPPVIYFLVYFVSSFLIAVVTTHLIENYFLSLRKVIFRESTQ